MTVENITITIAIIALAQPWLIGLYGRFFKQSQLDFYPTGRLEIGFSTYGPTVCIYGTLRCEHADAFIVNMQLQVQNQDNKATSLMQWLAFRKHTFNIQASSTDSQIELPSSFKMIVGTTRTFGVVYHDTNIRDRLADQLDPRQEDWTSYVSRNSTEAAKLISEDTTVNHDSLILDILEEWYLTEEGTQAAIRNTEIECYWREGIYSATLNVLLGTHKVKTVSLFTFELSRDDIESLRSNSAVLVRNLYSRIAEDFQFAYPQPEKQSLLTTTIPGKDQ